MNLRKSFLLCAFCACMVSRSQTTSIYGVINLYTNVTALSAQSATVGSSTSFNICDKVLIIQMKGASVTTANTIYYGDVTAYNNAGNYEFATISGVSVNVITFSSPLLRSYMAADLVQMVQVPVFNNVTITAPLICAPWNGITGGVLAFEATGNITMNSNIDVSGRGFLGGVVAAGTYSCGDSTNYILPGSTSLAAKKGEGIFNTPLLNAKGKSANGGGGGNNVNAGGAGGSNYGTGGRGGNVFTSASCPAYSITLCGGIGGQALNYSNTDKKIFLGGGGGAGHENDNVGTSGGNGGGIVIIKAPAIVGNNNMIISNGADVTTTTTIDGSGGGGGGGAVLLDVASVSGCTISAKGGYGGSDSYNGVDRHGKGGGGGGGIIWTSTALSGITTILNGGQPGVFTNPSSPYYNTTFGDTPGNAGGTLTGLSIPENIFSVTATPTVICSGQSSTLTVNGAGTYMWNNGTTGPTLVVSPLSTTVYTVTGSGACTANATATIAVAVAQGPTVAVIVSPSVICSGQSSTLTASGAATYAWSNSVVSAGQIVSPVSTTVYTVTGTNTSGCSAVAVATVSVAHSPSLSIIVTPSVICAGHASTLTVSGASTYVWNTGIAGSSVVVTPITTTAYTVVTATGSGPCSGSAVATVSVSKCVGIEELSGNEAITIYPNPFHENLMVAVPGNDSAQISIIDVLGKTVYTTELLSGNNGEVNPGYLPKGIYLLQVKTPGKISTFRIVRE